MALTDVARLKHLITQNPNFVFLSGAGVSTASGIPDFRGKNGLYKQFPNAEYLLSHDALMHDTATFFKFYKEQMLLDNIQPNLVHTTLAQWENNAQMGCIITQNIDGLHSLAGSKKVIELHGTVNRNYCIKCHKWYPISYVKKFLTIPKCSCGGLVRPFVVLYGESLHDGVIEACYEALSKTDLLIVAGTGLTVSTASSVVSMFRGKYLVILNNEPTSFDDRAHLVIRQDLFELFKELT